jgi:hypothetical protein
MKIKLLPVLVTGALLILGTAQVHANGVTDKDIPRIRQQPPGN